MGLITTALNDFWAIGIWIILLLLGILAKRKFSKVSKSSSIPISVNYHFTRKCNYSCKFCFHTENSSYILPISEAKHGLALLKEAGMRKINFAGGEPFLHRKYLAELLEYCKIALHLESVSIVSNASKIDEKFLSKYSRYIDLLAVSCDSFNEDINKSIGRSDGAGAMQVSHLYRVAAWCRKYKIKLKLNTVVCAQNVEEDMSQHVSHLAPFRWKVFQVLLVEGENDSNKTKRDARGLLISDVDFNRFIKRHDHLKFLVPESNRLMKSSYLILDEYMCFLDKDQGGKSQSILEIGVEEALKHVKWDEGAFMERSGLYPWTKEDSVNSSPNCLSIVSKDLEF